MQRPASHVLIETAPRSPQRLATSAIAVGTLHLVLIYALMTGLYIKVVPFIPHTIMARILPSEEPPAVPPSPPEIKLEQPRLEQVQMPLVKIDKASQDTITVTHVEHPVRVTPQPATSYPPTGVVSLMGTHSTPPYPPLSRRLGEQGKVGLRIFIAADGHISDVQVAKSSGLERLDEAARDWVRAHWLYRPATREGKAIAAETEAVVVFNLKTARR